MNTSSGTGGHSVRTSGGIRVHRRAVAADVRVAADVDPVRADPDGHRRIHAARLLPAALLLAAARAGILAAAVLLAAAVVRPEQAATRESRRERSGRDRNLNRLRDDLVHSAPPFFISREGPSLPTPRIMNFSISVVCWRNNRNQIWQDYRKGRRDIPATPS